MVTNASNYGSSSKGALGSGGVTDWLVQRKTALFLTLYFFYLGYFIFTNSPLSYNVWASLFQSIFFKVITIFALVAIVKHAWIGLWTIATDYLSCAAIRTLFLTLCKLLLLAYLIWGIIILWLV